MESKENEIINEIGKEIIKPLVEIISKRQFLIVNKNLEEFKNKISAAEVSTFYRLIYRSSEGHMNFDKYNPGLAEISSLFFGLIQISILSNINLPKIKGRYWFFDSENYLEKIIEGLEERIEIEKNIFKIEIVKYIIKIDNYLWKINNIEEENTLNIEEVNTFIEKIIFWCKIKLEELPSSIKKIFAEPFIENLDVEKSRVTKMEKLEWNGFFRHNEYLLKKAWYDFHPRHYFPELFLKNPFFLLIGFGSCQSLWTHHSTLCGELESKEWYIKEKKIIEDNIWKHYATKATFEEAMNKEKIKIENLRKSLKESEKKYVDKIIFGEAMIEERIKAIEEFRKFLEINKNKYKIIEDQRKLSIIESCVMNYFFEEDNSKIMKEESKFIFELSRDI